MLPANRFSGCLVKKVTLASHLVLAVVTSVRQHVKLGWHCGLHLGGIELKRFHAHEHKIGALMAHSRPHVGGATWRGGFGFRLGARNRMLPPRIKNCFERGPAISTFGHGVPPSCEKPSRQIYIKSVCLLCGRIDLAQLLLPLLPSAPSVVTIVSGSPKPLVDQHLQNTANFRHPYALVRGNFRPVF